MAKLAEQAFVGAELSSGGNSTVGRTLWNGRFVAIKDYRSREDFYVRALREWEALTLLWGQGSRLAPEPLGEDCASGLVVMEWLDGSPLLGDFTADQMMTVLREIHSLSTRALGLRIRDAADAIRSPTDLLLQADKRARLLGSSRAVREEADRVQELSAQLQATSFHPTQRVSTLSPSDFGPHNLLSTSRGTRLIDLEFFGWDDAHKLVGDTLVHPGFTWTDHEREQFRKQSHVLFGLDSARMSQVLVMSLVKWCVIILARADREYIQGNLSAFQDSLHRAQEYRLRAILWSEQSPLE